MPCPSKRNFRLFSLLISMNILWPQRISRQFRRKIKKNERNPLKSKIARRKLFGWNTVNVCACVWNTRKRNSREMEFLPSNTKSRSVDFGHECFSLFARLLFRYVPGWFFVVRFGSVQLMKFTFDSLDKIQGAKRAREEREEERRWKHTWHRLCYSTLDQLFL